MNAREKLLREVIWQAAQYGFTVALERTSRRKWLRINDAKVEVYASAISDPRSDGWPFGDRDELLMADTDFAVLVDRREPGGKALEDTWEYYIVSAEWVRVETQRDWTSYLDRQEAATGQRMRARNPHSKQITIWMSDRLREQRGNWTALATPTVRR